MFCCRYSGKVQDYNKAYEGAKAAIINKFYGPPTKGVFSPSVQYTLYQMALEILAKYVLLWPQHSELLLSAFLVMLHCQWLSATAFKSGCRVPETESIFFNLPNLHFLPCTPVTSKVSASVV